MPQIINLMEKKTLAKEAENIVENYLNLPAGLGCQTPYFNNLRRRSRGALLVLIGKGSPEEIAEEAKRFALKDRVDLKNLPKETIKKFLVDYSLGVDCSGFAYHVLDAEVRALKNQPLKKSIKIKGGLFRKLIAKLRPAGNIGVATLAFPENSFEVDAAKAKPGDIIVFLGTGREQKYNHALVVESVERDGNGTKIGYVNSYAWPSDGAYGHGVSRGKITVPAGAELLSGKWEEKGKTGTENYTFLSAQKAKSVSLRRMNILK